MIQHAAVFTKKLRADSVRRSGGLSTNLSSNSKKFGNKRAEGRNGIELAPGLPMIVAGFSDRLERRFTSLQSLRVTCNMQRWGNHPHADHKTTRRPICVGCSRECAHTASHNIAHSSEMQAAVWAAAQKPLLRVTLYTNSSPLPAFMGPMSLIPYPPAPAPAAPGRTFTSTTQ